MTLYGICLMSCDDATEFNIDLTDAELALVRKLSVASLAFNEYDCKPVLRITPPINEDDL